MKKSQVLAAIALAFALGVVAPVAGVVNTASAISIVDNEVLSNRADISSTIAAIEGQTEYQNYAAVMTAVNATKGDDAVDDDTVTATMVSGLVTEIQALGTVGETNYASYAAPATGTDAVKLQTVINDAKTALAAKTEKSYDLWNNLYVAMTDTSKNTSDNQKVEAIINAAEALGFKVREGYDAENDDLQDVKDEINNNTIYGTESYGTMVGDIVSGQTAINAVNAEIAALKSALAPFADARDIADAEKSATPIASLVALAPNMTKAGTRGKNYATLINDVNKVKQDLSKTTYDGDTTANTVVVNRLKSEYKAASGSDLTVAGTPSTDPTNPGVTIRTLTSEDGNVTVTGAFPADVTLKVEPTTTDVFGNKTYEAYDITLMQGDKKFDFNGAAAVTIKVSKVDAAKSTVYYVDSENKAAALTSTYSGSYITFNTTHFSLYAVVEGADSDNKGDDNKTDDTTPGNTGAIASANGTASSTVAVVAGIATALTAAGAGVVAYRNARREA